MTEHPFIQLVSPLRGQGGVLVLGWSLALYLSLMLFDFAAIEAGWRVLAAGFLCAVWVLGFGLFQQFAWIVLRQVVLQPGQPVRSFDAVELNPLMNRLSLKVALLVVVVAALFIAIYEAQPAIGTVLAVGYAAILPAVLAVMVVDERFLAGLDATRVARFVATLGWGYVPLAAALYVAYAALYAACIHAQPNVLWVLAANVVFVLGHVVAGRVIHHHRHALSVPVSENVGPTVDAAAATTAAIEALMIDLHRLCGVDRIDDAGDQLERFLSAHGFELDERIHRRLQALQDPRMLQEHTWHYLDRLIAANKLPRAWLLLKQALDREHRFRPRTADGLLALLTQATPEDADYVDGLLEDFERIYPGSQRPPTPGSGH